MSMSDYTAKIKSICDSLGSININVDEEEMVQVCLGGLTQRFDPLRTAILARENPPSFFDLQSMLLVEENHLRTKTKTSEGKMFFSSLDGGWGRGHDGPSLIVRSWQSHTKSKPSYSSVRHSNWSSSSQCNKSQRLGTWPKNTQSDKWYCALFLD